MSHQLHWHIRLMQDTKSVSQRTKLQNTNIFRTRDATQCVSNHVFRSFNVTNGKLEL